MFLSIIRLGIAVSAAALLASCGGSGQAETQQSTPEGLFNGTNNVAYSNSSATPPAPINQNILYFVQSNGIFYGFYTGATNSSNANTVLGAMQGTLTFSGGTMTSSNILEVRLPIATQSGSVFAAAFNNAPTFNGGYTTGINFSGYMVYPTPIDTVGDMETLNFNIGYNQDYQGIQDLGTLAGTYVGTVGTSGLAESATFTFGPASVPANSGNQFGVGTIVGTGIDGCSYTGTVSPLYKGNAYTTSITTGGFPCVLPNTQFTGLIYFDKAKNLLYSFSPNVARTDGLIFAGHRL